MSAVVRAEELVRRWVQRDPPGQHIKAAFKVDDPAADTELMEGALSRIVDLQQALGHDGLDALAPECEKLLFAMLDVGFYVFLINGFLANDVKRDAPGMLAARALVLRARSRAQNEFKRLMR